MKENPNGPDYASENRRYYISDSGSTNPATRVRFEGEQQLDAEAAMNKVLPGARTIATMDTYSDLMNVVRKEALPYSPSEIPEHVVASINKAGGTDFEPAMIRALAQVQRFEGIGGSH